MNIVENKKNLGELSALLGKNLSIDVVRKSTSRPNRGADDRLKISGIAENEFIINKNKYVGEYTLTNNNAKYAYHTDELNKQADVLVAEPSIHHLSEMKTHLKDRLVVILIAADTEYRKVRMNGRGTEEVSQVNKRVIEGDVQLFIASKLSGSEGERLVQLIDQDGFKIYEDIFA
jgi:ribose 1,5-bisphosphokinase PhnN